MEAKIRKTIFKIFLILCFYLIICYLIYNLPNKESIKNIKTNIQEKLGTPLIKEKPIGALTIKSINLKKNLYAISSKHNNIEENVTILPQSNHPSIKNGIIFIAAHSGAGELAYFKNLNQIKINDEINLSYENNQYTYIVKDYWEEPKTGTITVPKENNTQLILTTCSPTNENYQLIINCIQI